ncbi:MAG: class I SAM-dependent methyltransferase [Cyanobacteria bacterium CRU_2_1]|nr:class I SAM-dependent methyltransferase [Cyanobacteria bacterium CRU_2_1]
MGFKLESVVPWGRSLDEYTRMFDLSSDDLQKNILDCGGGPASFNVEMTQNGGHIISCDPIYRLSVQEIEQRIQETYNVIVEGVRANYDDYVWEQARSPDALGQIRLKAMHRFLQDFPAGLATNRYQVAELPELPFRDRQFDLALCGYLLFTYSDHLSQFFHLSSIRELCRVATEVRIFPLLTISGEPSPFLPIAIQELQQQGYHVEIRTVPYEFQKGGNQMLLCHQQNCHP